MSSIEQGDAHVRTPFTVIPREDIAKDRVLESLVQEKYPNAVIGIPYFEGVVYLRTQMIRVGNGWNAGIVSAPELGLYYDRTKQSLIDIERREDGNIVPTEFTFSMGALYRMGYAKVMDDEQ